MAYLDYPKYNYTPVPRSPLLAWLDDAKDPPYDVEEVGNVQQQRMDAIVRVCKKYQHKNESNKGMFAGHSSVLMFRNTLMCKVPKAGSTNLLNQMCLLVGKNCTQNNMINIHNFINRYVKSFPFERLVDANNYFKFVVVRSPWTRLVSTYRQKFIETTQYISLCSVAKNYNQFDKRIRASGNIWTFQDFLEKCVIGEFNKSGRVGMDTHWRPENVCGSFCAIQYNFIAKIETMDVDNKVIVHQWTDEVDQLIQSSLDLRRPNETAHATSHTYTEYWEAVNKTVIDQLRQIYKLDFEMFQYPTDPL